MCEARGLQSSCGTILMFVVSYFVYTTINSGGEKTREIEMLKIVANCLQVLGILGRYPEVGQCYGGAMLAARQLASVSGEMMSIECLLEFDSHRYLYSSAFKLICPIIAASIAFMFWSIRGCICWRKRSSEEWFEAYNRRKALVKTSSANFAVTIIAILFSSFLR